MTDKKNSGSHLLSMFAGLCALNTLLMGVIPSIKFDNLDVPVGFYDIIQYLPVLQAVFAVLSMSCVILTAIFSFISFIPRAVSFVTASAAFVTALATVITLDAGVIYAKSGFANNEYLSAEKRFNNGLEYNFIIVLFLLLGLVCVLLAAAAWNKDRTKNVQSPISMKAEKKKAVLRQPPAAEKNTRFRPPEDF